MAEKTFPIVAIQKNKKGAVENELFNFTLDSTLHN